MIEQSTTKLDLLGMSIESVIEKLGLTNSHYHRVSGGDINSCWCIVSNDSKYFLKVNSAVDYPGMFRLEAEGLSALKDHSSFIIPEAIKHDVAGKEQFLLIDWLEAKPGNKNEQRQAGEKLANLHLHQQEKFGWPENNYIGSLQQINTVHGSWNSFYAECRIKPLIKLLFDKNIISREDVITAEKFCLRLNEIFPREPASLLHGDLWSGNYMNTDKGPSVFDPAVYYGHREMDIGMTKLFGGFDENFYRGYESVFPLEKGWRQRLRYSQLYPLLVHAVLFGGQYVNRSMDILRE